jgi:hypothetical protein
MMEGFMLVCNKHSIECLCLSLSIIQTPSVTLSLIPPALSDVSYPVNITPHHSSSSQTVNSTQQKAMWCTTDVDCNVVLLYSATDITTVWHTVVLCHRYNNSVINSTFFRPYCSIIREHISWCRIKQLRNNISICCTRGNWTLVHGIHNINDLKGL